MEGSADPDLPAPWRSKIRPAMALRQRLKRVPGLVAVVAVARRARSRLGRAVAHGSHWWRPAPDGRAVPPPELLYRVSGAANVEWFLTGGRWALDSIEELLSRSGRALAPGARVLDFGCGCGRVARHWLARGGVDLTGTDADAAAIRWCRGHLTDGRFEANGPEPPLPFADGEFDLVYALSVFTHLRADLQTAWLAELGRVLRPGGLVAFSVHGTAYLAELAPAEQAEFRAGRLVVVGGGASGSNDCNAFHPEAYVREDLASGWEILAWEPEAARGNPRQDLILLQKK